MDTVRSGEEPYMQFDKMSLRNYFPHEIEKLSVVQIYQTKTFDEIGHPVRGGLYDPLLGPTETFDRCETCHQQEMYCPGHVGHVKLDVPVFNPLLFSFTYNLLKGTCVQCHKFTCGSSNIAARIVMAQMRCFELGVPSAAEEIGQKMQASNQIDTLNKPDLDAYDRSESNEAMLNAEIDKLICDITGKSISQLKADNRPCKNQVDMKKNIVKTFLREHLFRRKQKCPLCKGKNGTLRNDGGMSVLIDFSSKSAKVKDPKSRSDLSKNLAGTEYDDEEYDEEEEEKKKMAEQSIDNELQSMGTTDVTKNSLDLQMRAVKNGECEKLAWRAAEVREHFRLMWKWDGRLLSRLFPMFSDTACGKLCPTDGLFSELIVVPATKFRPIRLFQGERFENPQTVTLRKLLESNETIKAIKLMMKGSKDSTLAEMIAARVQGRTINARMHNAYLQLQMRANAIFDQELDRSDAAARVPGIKQILEKKQGLFRMNMMGKRVNYACRSVITPDPYLDVDEIGIPEVFARKLTFTEPVNLVNVQQMRKLVKVGNTQHPGANFVRKHNGQTVLLNNPKKAESEGSAMAMRLQPADTNSLAPPMKVLRHLQKGDMVMMNRQPSLHKPSIMGHRARVLRGQRALRMNYAPCKAYNADFDGDEMNGHLVQTHIAQTEVRELANVGSNYLVPKDATPLLGLIQDHVVSGVYLTLRGRFLNKEDFMHLVLASFAETDQRIELPPPAMLLPRKLWSGKQVITAIIQNCIPPGKPMINLTGKAKTPLSCWKVRGHKAPDFNMSESEVVFRNGELLVGVLDKAHYGATQFGLIHCCFELYGHRVGARILSCFSRLFTTYLQYHGFTLGVADILVRDDANVERKKAVRESRTIGDDVVKSTFNLDENATPAQIKHVLASTYCNPRGIGQDVKMLDYGMKQGIAKYNDAINKACVPEGLIRSFPQNALQMMIQSGAKGSAVNAIQISCCLGQIELEGKRMAVTVAGRTLPSFRAFDPSPRAGGYIDQRFLTGINPQELFFHTMAGREGLIDTAVKTSRSGYLQRCIIKHLEGIKLHYDSTARDHDGSVIQFRYGEDGMDVCKSAFMQPKLFDFIEQNEEAVLMSSKPEGIRDRDMGVEDAEKHFNKIRKWKKKAAAGKGRARYTNGFVEFSKEREGTPKAQLLEEWAEMEVDDRETYRKRAGKYCPSPVDEARNPTRTLGALPEKLLDSIEKYIEDKREKLKRTLFWKGNRSLCEPGENVGLLAAQSIGEPSTQMTLNTFHFAGRGEMNVTLGIPRLREILMTASKSIATPSAQISVIPGTSRDRIDRIKQEMERVYLKNVLKKFTLDERINLADGKSWRRYALRLEILASSKRESQYRHLKRSKIMQEIEKRFIRTVGSVIDKAYKEVRDYQQIQHRKLREGNFNAGIIEERDEPSQLKKRVDDGMSSDEEADGGRDADAGEARLNQRHRDDAAEYEGEDDDRANVEQPEEEEAVVSDAGEDEEGASGDDEEGESNRDRAERNRQSRNARIQSVVSSLDSVVEYRLDEKDEDRWCEVVFELPLWNKSKLDLCTIIDREVERFIVSQTTGIERCIEREETVKGENTIILQTQGVNLDAFFRHSDVLDVNSVQSNDLNLVLNQYGVEACSRSIVNEMNNVFAVYGIEVSKRHLSLTADYMTFTGKIEPFNRGAMAAAASPLQKMTFETTVAFLRDSLISGDDDHLSSPSARLVLGSLNRGGTGAFDLVLNKEASK